MSKFTVIVKNHDAFTERFVLPEPEAVKAFFAIDGLTADNFKQALNHFEAERFAPSQLVNVYQKLYARNPKAFHQSNPDKDLILDQLRWVDLNQVCLEDLALATDTAELADYVRMLWHGAVSSQNWDVNDFVDELVIV